MVIEFTCDFAQRRMRVRPVWSKRCVTVFHQRLSGGTCAADRRKCQKRAGDYRQQYSLKGDACQLLISGEDEAGGIRRDNGLMRDEFLTVTRAAARCANAGCPAGARSRFRGWNPTLFHAHPVCAGSAGDAGSSQITRSRTRLGELPGSPSVPNRSRRRWINGLRLLVKDIELRLLTRRHRQRDPRSSPFAGDGCPLRQHPLGGILTGLSCAWRLSPPATTSRPVP